MTRLTLAAVLASCLAAGPLSAQTSPPAGSPPAAPRGEIGAAPTGSVGSTRTGELPERAGSTTAVGRTKPAGAPVGDERGTRPDLEAKSRELTRRIERGICTGCN